ncbi:MAG: DHH family phosphoesterase [Haloarculaceae archaeon]
MHTRLMLGCGSLGRTLVDSLVDWPGDLLVIVDDEQQVETLREDGIAAERADVTDATALGSVVEEVESLFVGGDDVATNVDAVRAAREAFDDVPIVAYTGHDPSDAQRESLVGTADRIVDATDATTAFLRERVGDEGLRTRQLHRVLRELDEPLAVFTHDNPDPDAIASAVALERLATAAGVDAEICYYGSITHQENRAFVNLLEFDLTELDDDDDLSAYGSFALVDHSRPGVNDQLPEDTPIDVVIDHHPPRSPVNARFVDLRSEVGATSTLLVGYLRQLDVEVSEAVATGLLFGIRVDTREFTREVCPEDLEAAAFLLPHVDMGALERIESPSISPDTFETIAAAIRNRDRHGPVLLTCVGYLNDRDALAQAADRLLNLDGITTTMAYGIGDGTIYVSARARGANIDLGETLRDAFEQIGSAGGHADMAGAQIPLGLLDSIDDDDEALIDVVRDVVSERFLEAVESRTNKVSVTRGVDPGADYRAREVRGLLSPPEAGSDLAGRARRISEAADDAEDDDADAESEADDAADDADSDSSGA